jgi:hypothetical protein
VRTVAKGFVVRVTTTTKGDLLSAAQSESFSFTVEQFEITAYNQRPVIAAFDVTICH